MVPNQKEGREADKRERMSSFFLLSSDSSNNISSSNGSIQVLGIREVCVCNVRGYNHTFTVVCHPPSSPCVTVKKTRYVLVPIHSNKSNLALRSPVMQAWVSDDFYHCDAAVVCVVGNKPK